MSKLNILRNIEQSKVDDINLRFQEILKIQFNFRCFLSDMSSNIEKSSANILRNCVNLKNKLEPIQEMLKEQLNFDKDTDDEQTKKFEVFIDYLPKQVIVDQQDICKELQNLVNHTFFGQIVKIDNMLDKITKQKKYVVDELNSKLNKFKAKQKLFIQNKKKFEKSLKNLDYYDKLKTNSKSDINFAYNRSHIDEVDYKLVNSFEENVANESALQKIEIECMQLLMDFQSNLQMHTEMFQDLVGEFQTYLFQFQTQLICNLKETVNVVEQKLKSINNIFIYCKPETIKDFKNYIMKKMMEMLDLKDIDILSYQEEYQQKKLVQIQEKDQLSIFSNFDQFYQIIIEIQQQQNSILKQGHIFFIDQMLACDSMFNNMCKYKKNFDDKQKYPLFSSVYSQILVIFQVDGQIQKVFQNVYQYMKMKENVLENMIIDYTNKQKPKLEQMNKSLQAMNTAKQSYIKIKSTVDKLTSQLNEYHQINNFEKIKSTQEELNQANKQSEKAKQEFYQTNNDQVLIFLQQHNNLDQLNTKFLELTLKFFEGNGLTLQMQTDQLLNEIKDIEPVKPNKEWLNTLFVYRKSTEEYANNYETIQIFDKYKDQFSFFVNKPNKESSIRNIADKDKSIAVSCAKIDNTQLIEEKEKVKEEEEEIKEKEQEQIEQQNQKETRSSISNKSIASIENTRLQNLQTLAITSKYQKKFSLKNNAILYERISCALYQKIMLQGKIYIFNDKLCFHSYFNPKNLLFGQTVLIIPFDDILGITKKTNAVIFDNSIEINSRQGAIFFTSFISRDCTYLLMNKILKELCPNFIEDTEVVMIMQKQSSEQDQIAKAESEGQPILSEQKVQSEQKEYAEEQEKEGKKSVESLSISNNSNILQVQIKNLSDIGKEEVIQIDQQERLTRIQQLMIPFEKYDVSFEYVFNNVSLVQFIQIIFSDNQSFNYDNSSYDNFQSLINNLLKDSDIQQGTWDPPCQPYFLGEKQKEFNNELDISVRKLTYNHKLRVQMAFAPSHSGVKETQKAYWLSEQQVAIESQIKSFNVPYCDYFVVNRAFLITQQDKNTMIKFMVHVDIVKSTVFAGRIRKEAIKENSLNWEMIKGVMDKVIQQQLPIIMKGNKKEEEKEELEEKEEKQANNIKVKEEKMKRSDKEWEQTMQLMIKQQETMKVILEQQQKQNSNIIEIKYIFIIFIVLQLLLAYRSG